MPGHPRGRLKRRGGAIIAITMILQYKKVGRWRDYLYGEKTYMILSLVAKSLLAWQVWSGTLRPG